MGPKIQSTGFYHNPHRFAVNQTFPPAPGKSITPMMICALLSQPKWAEGAFHPKSALQFFVFFVFNLNDLPYVAARPLCSNVNSSVRATCAAGHKLASSEIASVTPIARPISPHGGAISGT